MVVTVSSRCILSRELGVTGGTALRYIKVKHCQFPTEEFSWLSGESPSWCALSPGSQYTVEHTAHYHQDHNPTSLGSVSWNTPIYQSSINNIVLLRVDCVKYQL
eukprot:sb/3478064/